MGGGGEMALKHIGTGEQGLKRSSMQEKYNGSMHYMGRGMVNI